MSGVPSVTVVTPGAETSETPAPLTHAEHEQIVSEATTNAVEAAATVAEVVAESTAAEVRADVEEARETADAAIIVAFNAESECLSLRSEITNLSTQMQEIRDLLTPSQSQTPETVEIPVSDDADAPVSQTAEPAKRKRWSWF